MSKLILSQKNRNYLTEIQGLSSKYLPIILTIEGKFKSIFQINPFKDKQEERLDYSKKNNNKKINLDSTKLKTELDLIIAQGLNKGGNIEKFNKIIQHFVNRAIFILNNHKSKKILFDIYAEMHSNISNIERYIRQIKFDRYLNTNNSELIDKLQLEVSNQQFSFNNISNDLEYIYNNMEDIINFANRLNELVLKMFS